jgi:hypothetical protein
VKVLIELLVMVGLVVGTFARAEEPNGGHPQHWVIVATIIDRTTGKQRTEDQVGGPEMEFTGSAACESMLNRLRQVDTELATAVLTCRQKLEPPTS